MKNKAAVMTGIKKMEFREIPMPEPKANEVIIRVEYVGICGSDAHYYEHGRIGDYVVEGDFILGHESGGTVVDVGSSVTHLKEGDRVALEPGSTCGACEYCLSGHYNLCPDVVFHATPPYNGSFSNYIAFPAHLAFKLPEGVSTKEGALVEPLAVGLEACTVSQVTLGSTVVILGSGCIGLMSLLSAKAFGATNVIVVDVAEKRLNKALELGATHVINATKTDVVQAVLEKTGGLGGDVVMETAGATITTQQTPFLVKRGGKIVLVGMPPEDIISFNFAKVMGNVATIIPIFRYKNQYPKAIRALSAGKIDISGIVTHEFDFNDISEAFRVNIEEKQDVVKVIIKLV